MGSSVLDACRKGDLAAVREALDADSSILRVAGALQHNHGTEVADRADASQENVLEVAARAGHADVVRELLSRGTWLVI